MDGWLAFFSCFDAPSSPPSDKDDLLRVTADTRPLGLCVLRGTAVMAVAPTAGAEVLASNPFAEVAAE